MSTVEFTGTTSGDMTVATNYAGGVAPIGGDSVVFKTGSRTVTVGPGVDLVDVTCTSGWSGSFGTPGAPVAFGSVTTFLYAGSGDGCYISVNTGKTIGKFTAQRGLGTISGLGTVTALYVENADFSATLTGLTAFFVMTASGRLSIGTSATAISGDSTSYGTTTVEDRSSATLRTVGRSSRLQTKGTAAITTALHILDGAIHNHLSSGTIAAAHVSGAGSLITPANSPYTSATITVLNVYSGAKYVQYANGTNFAIGTLNVFGSQSVSGPEQTI